jgi:hypothetical protein
LLNHVASWYVFTLYKRIETVVFNLTFYLQYSVIRRGLTIKVQQDFQRTPAYCSIVTIFLLVNILWTKLINLNLFYFTASSQFFGREVSNLTLKFAVETNIAFEAVTPIFSNIVHLNTCSISTSFLSRFTWTLNLRMFSWFGVLNRVIEHAGTQALYR